MKEQKIKISEITEKEIVKMYVEDKMSAQAIAKSFGYIGHTGITNVLRKNNIEIRPPKYYQEDGRSTRIKKMPREKIVEEYTSIDITTRQLAEKYQCGQRLICLILKSFNIDTKSKWDRLRYKGRAIVWNEQTKVIELYLEGKTMSDISKCYKCDSGTVRRLLLKHKIELRPPKVYMVGHKFNVGRPCKESTKKKIGLAHTGKKLSREHIEKMRASKKGKIPNIPHLFKKGHKTWNTGLTAEQDSRIRSGNKHHMFGIRRTIEEKQKFREYGATAFWPKQNTSIEIKIQNFLKELKIEFFTHQYMGEITHVYRCDILINPQLNFMAQRRTIIEIDGDYWHGNPKKYPEEKLSKKQREQKEEDACRNEELSVVGFQVIRIWEMDIRKMSLEKFKDILFKSIKSTELNPPEVKNEIK